MVQVDYRGARGANAGDDFHELWALRQALALLDQDTALTAIAVEGLRAEDESGTPQDTWDGVDCNEAAVSLIDSIMTTLVELRSELQEASGQPINH